MNDLLPDAGFTMAYHAWLKSDLSDAEKVTLWAICSLWNPMHQRWVENPTVGFISEFRGIHLETAKAHYRAIEAAGIITREYLPKIGGGREATFTLNLPTKPCTKRVTIDDSEGSPNTSFENSEGSPNASFTKEVQTLPSIKENNKEKNLNPKNDVVVCFSAQEEGANSEPFELPPSANPAAMPTVASVPFRESPPREYRPVQVPQEMRDRIYTTLGTYGDEFVRYLTQEMIDRPRFVDDVLRSASRGKRPIGLAIKLLKDFGNWIDPMERHEKDKQVRNEIFFRKMGVSK